MTARDVEQAERVLREIMSDGESYDIDNLIARATEAGIPDEAAREALWNFLDRDELIFNRDFRCSLEYQ